MLKIEDFYVLSLFVSSSGYILPYSKNENLKISKTIYPYLLGKRNIYYFYNLEKSLYGIRASLGVLGRVIADGGDILCISDSPILEYIYSDTKSLQAIKWKRGSLSKSNKVDLVFLSDVNKENLVEVHRKCLVIVGVGSCTLSQMSYPFNLNIESTLLSYWFFNTIFTTCQRGLKKKLKKKVFFPSLLGEGYSKIIYTNEI